MKSLPRTIALLAFAVAMTVTAQKDSSMSPRPQLLGSQLASAVLPPDYILVSVGTNEVFDFTAPDGAVADGIDYSISPTAKIHSDGLNFGGIDDAFRFVNPRWPVPFGGGESDSFYASAFGEIGCGDFRFRPCALELGIAPSNSWDRLSVAPSRFWYALTPANSVLLTWENSVIGNEASAQGSMQIELCRDGDIRVRYAGLKGLVTSELYRRPNAHDADGDGLADEIDPEPNRAGVPAFGTGDAWVAAACSNIMVSSAISDPVVWADGVNSNRYYFLDFSIANGTGYVSIVGDGATNLGNLAVVARGGEPCRVPLLKGVTYLVESERTLASCAAPSPEVEVERLTANRYRVRWPVCVNFVPWGVSPFNAFLWIDEYRLEVTPSDLGATLRWEGCPCGHAICLDGETVTVGCGPTCACDGCTVTGALQYEGYTLAFSHRLGCPGSPQDAVRRPSLQVAANPGAIIYEDTYRPTDDGQWVPRRSTRGFVSCRAEGGDLGGTMEFACVAGGGHLMWLGSFPRTWSETVAPGGEREIAVELAGANPSDRENDVVFRAVFTENLTGAKFTNEVAFTVFKVRVWADQTAPENQATDRHKFGICEYIRYANEPVSSQLVWQVNGKGGRFGKGIFDDPVFECPLDGCADPLAAEAVGARYVPRIDVVEPEAMIASNVVLKTYGIPAGEAGGVGMTVDTYLIPMDVFFGHIDVVEVPCDIGTHDGYFAVPAFSNSWTHTVENGAGRWHEVQPGNFAGKDTAALTNLLCRMDDEGRFQYDSHYHWQRGHMIWQVPVGWDRRRANVPASSRPATDVPHATNIVLRQEFAIFQDGMSGVRKFGYQVTRTTNDVSYLTRIFE